MASCFQNSSSAGWPLKRTFPFGSTRIIVGSDRTRRVKARREASVSVSQRQAGAGWKVPMAARAARVALAVRSTRRETTGTPCWLTRRETVVKSPMLARHSRRQGDQMWDEEGLGLGSGLGARSGTGFPSRVPGRGAARSRVTLPMAWRRRSFSMRGARAGAWDGLSQKASVTCFLKAGWSPFSRAATAWAYSTMESHSSLTMQIWESLRSKVLVFFKELGDEGGEAGGVVGVHDAEEAGLEDGLLGEAGGAGGGNGLAVGFGFAGLEEILDGALAGAERFFFRGRGGGGVFRGGWIGAGLRGRKKRAAEKEPAEEEEEFHQGILRGFRGMLSGKASFRHQGMRRTGRG